MGAMREQDSSFTGDALAELAVMRDALKEVLSITIKSFLGNDLALAERVEPLEEVINELQDNIKNRHVERMKAGICTMTQGISLNDLLTDLERISDHCSNIALSAIELHKNSFRTHASLHHREESRKEIEKLYNEYSRRFALPAPSAEKSA
jgi:phosphate:Na+ symporter